MSSFRALRGQKITQQLTLFVQCVAGYCWSFSHWPPAAVVISVLQLLKVDPFLQRVIGLALTTSRCCDFSSTAAESWPFPPVHGRVLLISLAVTISHCCDFSSTTTTGTSSRPHWAKRGRSTKWTRPRLWPSVSHRLACSSGHQWRQCFMCTNSLVPDLVLSCLG